jgi:hypothetical protein
VTVDAYAEVTLTPSHRRFRLPAGGTPSLLFRFGRGDSAVTLGAIATDKGGVPFGPGTEHGRVRLHFWADEASGVVECGASFVVWYGGDVGTGRITATD